MEIPTLLTHFRTHDVPLVLPRAGGPVWDGAELHRSAQRSDPEGYALTALLAVRRLRANHKHTTRAVVAFVLEHPQADALIEAGRPALADCFEHALGKATARGCARFAEMWMALVCFAYGVAAWRAEPEPGPVVPYEADRLAGLRAELARDRAARLAEVATWLPAGGGEPRLVEEERCLDLRLCTLTGDGLTGQAVTEHGRPVYASVFARR